MNLRTATFQLNSQRADRRYMGKSELAREYGVARNTFGRYLKKIEHRLPDYDRSQQLLSPAQVRVVREVLG